MKAKYKFCKRCEERIWKIYIKIKTKYVATKMFYCPECKLIETFK